MAGGIQRGGAPGARPPKIEKNMIFWCKIMIFHTKYPKNVRISLRSVIDFLLAHKSTLKPTIVYPLKKMNMMIKL
jgi:hypothetical protein